MDIYSILILIKNKKINKFEDKTAEISNLRYVGNKVVVTFLNTNKTYSYNYSNVRVLKEPNIVNGNKRDGSFCFHKKYM